VDPFATLGIPYSFDVDLGAVERAHRELSRTLHPDRFVGAGRRERTAALAKAVEVNEAWRIVRDPIRRAEALLKRQGVVVSEAAEPRQDAEFLMEMLEQREALSDARRARDLPTVRAMAGRVEARARDVERALSEGFARDDAPPKSGGAIPDWEALVGKLGELRFYRRFLDEVSAIEDELAA
jgi:molecular chaperone HscB